MCVCVPSIFICLCVYAGICPRKDFIMHMYLNTHNNRRGCIWTTFCSFASHCSASVASVARWGLYLHTHWHFLLKLLTSVVTSARDATSRWFSIIKHSYFSSLSLPLWKYLCFKVSRSWQKSKGHAMLLPPFEKVKRETNMKVCCLSGIHFLCSIFFTVFLAVRWEFIHF